MMKAPVSVLRFFPTLRREAITLVLLSILVAVSVSAVAGLSRIFHTQQDALAQRWTARGSEDLKINNFRAAADEFRAALRYSHDGFDAQLGLAQALIGLDRVNEASAYLVNLWSVQPENGLVNLELARIAAGRGDKRLALRYYHNAIYAIWPSATDATPETARRRVRWELIKYQLTLNAKANAQSELISLAAEVGDDPAEQKNLGEYFLKVGDSEHALAAYRLYLTAAPRDVQALAGAGEAAFSMGSYTQSERYLMQAQAISPNDHKVAAQLETATLAISMDPFRRQLSDTERNQAVRAAFAAAGDRLNSCPGAAGYPAAFPSASSLGATWKQLQPHIAGSVLGHNADLVNQAMNLSFMIERQSASQCGAGTPADTALLLISKLHEGN